MVQDDLRRLEVQLQRPPFLPCPHPERKEPFDERLEKVELQKPPPRRAWWLKPPPLQLLFYDEQDQLTLVMKRKAYGSKVPRQCSHY